MTLSLETQISRTMPKHSSDRNKHGPLLLHFFHITAFQNETIPICYYELFSYLLVILWTKYNYNHSLTNLSELRVKTGEYSVAISILQRVKACVHLCSQPFYLCKAVEGCICLICLMHHTFQLYIWVNPIILYKLRYYSISGLSIYGPLKYGPGLCKCYLIHKFIETVINIRLE